MAGWYDGVMVGCLALMVVLGVTGAEASMRNPDAFGGVKEIEQVVRNTPRPFVLVNERELEFLRSSVAKDGWRREMYLRQVGPSERDEQMGVGAKTIADRWLACDIKIPGYGGHGHLFYCDCGKRLPMPEDMELKPSYTCTRCGKTFSGERYDGAVRVFRHHQLANAAANLAVVYGIEKDHRYSDKVAEILRKYAEAYPGPHTSGTAGGIMYQSLNEAMWVIPLAQAYDLIYDSGSLSDSDKRAIEDKLFRPVAKGLIASGNGGNWGSWHFSAVGVIGFAIKDAGMVDYALKHMREQLINYLGDDGLWPESVHTYHFFVVTTFTFFAEACYRAGIDVYNWEPKPGKGFKLMFTAPLEYMYPSFRLPAINDGWYGSCLPMQSYEIARRRWNDPVFDWVLEEGYKRESNALAETPDENLDYLQGGRLYRFLFGSELGGDPPAPEFRSTNFSNFGLCTLRSGGMMLTFHYGKFLGHGHLDKLGFTLFANDQPLIPDYGTTGYGSPIGRWYQGTMGHNAVVVDGKSQERSKENELEAFHAGKFMQYASAWAKDVYEGVAERRRILLLDGVCVIEDTLRSDAAHDYDWIIHCEGKPDAVGSHGAAELDKSAYPLVDFEKVEQAGDGYELKWRSEKGDLELGMWAGAGAVVGLGSCPANSTSGKASFMMCRQHGREARFISVFAAAKPGEKALIGRNGDVLSVTRGDTTDYIYIRGVSGGASGDLITDGEIAAVRVRSGKAVEAGVVSGSMVKWKGEVVGLSD